MTHLAARTLEEETETDRLRTELAEARTDLQRRDAALLTLQGELTASRFEVAGARGETIQFQALLRHAEETAAAAVQACASLQSAAGRRDAEIAQLHAVIATLQAETSGLRAGMDVLRASASWRISAPVRVAGRLMPSIRAAASPLLRTSRRAPPDQPEPAAPPPTALPSPGDPNARVIFQAARLVDDASGEAEGVVTLDGLYHLSRSI